MAQKPQVRMLDGLRRRSLYRKFRANRWNAFGPVRGNSSVVEHRLAKARVEGSNPFSRSLKPRKTLGFFVCARLIDA